MTPMLIIVHVVGPIVETVQRLRPHPEESEDGFFNRAIKKAYEIVRKGTPQGFDPESDSCEIHAIDEKTGEGTAVWAMDAKDSRSE
jgi:hypothetical protein